MSPLPSLARAWILAILLVAIGPARAEEPVTCDGGARPGDTRCGEGAWAGYRIECQPDGNWAQVGDEPDPGCGEDQVPPDEGEDAGEDDASEDADGETPDGDEPDASGDDTDAEG